LYFFHAQGTLFNYIGHTVSQERLYNSDSLCVCTIKKGTKRKHAASLNETCLRGEFNWLVCRQTVHSKRSYPLKDIARSLRISIALTEGKISLTRRRWVNELQVEYNLNNSEFVDKGDKNYFLYSITQQRSTRFCSRLILLVF